MKILDIVATILFFVLLISMSGQGARNRNRNNNSTDSRRNGKCKLKLYTTHGPYRILTDNNNMIGVKLKPK